MGGEPGVPGPSSCLQLQWGVPAASRDTRTSCRQHAAHAAHCSNAQVSKHRPSCDSFVCC